MKKILINYGWIVLDAIFATLLTITADYLLSIENEVQWAAVATLMFIPISKALKKKYEVWKGGITFNTL